MLRRLLIIVAILLLPGTRLMSSDLEHSWSHGFGEGGSATQSFGRAVATDPAGNAVLTGYSTADIDFGCGLLAGYGSEDIVLAKFDPAGNCIWSKRFGDSDRQWCNDVAIDGAGNVFIAGEFRGSVNFGGSTLSSAGVSDIYLAKFDASGIHIWSKRFGGLSSEGAAAIEVDAAGNILVAGTFGGSGPLDLGGAPLYSDGYQDLYLAKFDSFGSHIWSNSYGDQDQFQYIDDITVDGAGNVSLIAYGMGSLDFGGGLLVGQGSYDIFVAKFDGDGAHVWSDRFGDFDTQYGHGISSDKNNNVIITGLHRGTIDFGGGPLTSDGYDVFVASFDSDGNHNWSGVYAAYNTQFGNAITTDDAGNVIITGRSTGEVDFGGGTLSTAGGQDIFIARYDRAGTHVWSALFGDAADQEGLAITTDAAGHVYVTGTFEGMVNFGGSTISSGANKDIFLAKFNQPYPDVISVEDVGNDQGRLARIVFSRSGWDAAGSPTPILQYEGYRRIDALPLVPTYDVEKKPFLETASDQSVLSQDWEYVGAVPAHGESEYNMIVSTLADSTITYGMHWSVFFIRAATANPLVYYDSDPDSGYSLDNLAPAAPHGLAMNSEQVLSWEPCMESDVSFYTVYGLSDTPASGNDDRAVIGQTSDPQFDVSQAIVFATYLVTATDEAGNEGSPAEYHRSTTGVDPVSTKSRLSLQAYPNPFNPETVIRYTTPARGNVRITVYDVSGRLICELVNSVMEAGDHTVLWNGRNNNGAVVANGVFVARIETGEHQKSTKLVLLK